MKIYTLKFALPHGAGETIHFEAFDLPEALMLAHREAATRDAELWDGETRLCAIRRSKDVPLRRSPIVAAPDIDTDVAA